MHKVSPFNCRSCWFWQINMYCLATRVRDRKLHNAGQWQLPGILYHKLICFETKSCVSRWDQWFRISLVSSMFSTLVIRMLLCTVANMDNGQFGLLDLHNLDYANYVVFGFWGSRRYYLRLNVITSYIDVPNIRI